MPRAVVIGHFTLALAGLGIWIAFVATGAAAVAWVAVAVILSIAGLGMATLAGGLPDAASDESASSGTDERASPGPARPVRPCVRHPPGWADR